MGAVDPGQRGDGALWRFVGAPDHGDEFQRFLRSWFPGAVWSVGADRSDHAGIHQPAASAAINYRGSRRGRRSVETTAYHDDDAGGHSWAVAGCSVARDWLRLSTALCDCDRGRTDCRPGDEHLSA